MILNLWANFEFLSLWNYHFTLYALKCKNSKLMVAKWDVNSGIYILMSWDRAKTSSHWAEIPSQDHFKIQASKPLSRDSSHWAIIWPSQAEIYFKPKSKPPSLWAEIRAIEPRYESSQVEPKYLHYSFVNKFKGFIKITHWV